MAITVELRTGNNATTAVDLAGGTDGFYILRDGWVQRQARRDAGVYQPVFESMTLTLSATSHNDLATKIQTLNTKLEDVTDFADRAVMADSVKPVYIRAKLNNETDTRRAVLYEIAAEPNHDLNSPPVSPGNFVPAYLVTLERHPFWEDAVAMGAPATSAVSVVGGEYAYSTSTPGDVPARISTFQFLPVAAGTGYALSDVWMGHRTSKYGALNTFNPNWDLGDAGAELHTDTALETAIAQAINNTAARVSMSTGTITVEPRVTLRMAEIISWLGISAQAGTHIGLLRARHTAAGDVFKVRLLHGLYDGQGASDSSKWVASDLIAIPASGVTAGNFYYYDMGLVNIPPSRVAVTNWGKGAAFRIEAGATSTSGGGYLDLDAITLIPVSEGAISVKGANITVTAATERILRVYTSEDDVILAETGVGTGSFLRSCEFTPYDWGLPTGTGMYVVAAQRAYQSNKNDEIGFSGTAWVRWLTLAGNP